MNELHVICRQALGVRLIERPDQYESGWWDVSLSEAERLVGGRLFLHEKKAEPSYFGGDVLDFREDDLNPGSGRVIFHLRSVADGKGAKWKGQSHGMAWTGRIVEADKP